MNCKEFHRYWDDESGVTPLPSDSVECAEHAATCPECHGFWEERNELAKFIQLVRDSTPAVPASVDWAVLEGYRRLLSGQDRSVVPAPWTTRVNLRGALSWAAAVGFACAVAYGGMFLLVPPPHRHVTARVAERRAVPAQTTGNVRPAMAAQQPSRNIRPVPVSAPPRKHPTSVVEQDTSLQTRFQSLMYCDPISCPGAMDVIRLELSSPVLGVTPTAARTNGPVYAEVLVGPDGIARGIRVVE